jgi:hypothetical protein
LPPILILIEFPSSTQSHAAQVLGIMSSIQSNVESYQQQFWGRQQLDISGS